MNSLNHLNSPNQLSSSVANKRANSLWPYSLLLGWLLLGPAATGATLFVYAVDLQNWLGNHGSLAQMALVVLGIILMSLGGLPTFGVAAFCGWALGGWEGFFVSWTMSVSAAFGCVVCSRLVFSRDFAVRLESHPRLKFVIDDLKAQSGFALFWLIGLCRIPPQIPFALFGFVCGTTKVPMIPFLLGSFWGMIPRMFVVAWSASKLKELSRFDVEGTAYVVLQVVVLFAVVFWIGSIAWRSLERRSALSKV